MQNDTFWAIREKLIKMGVGTFVSLAEIRELGADTSTIQRLRRWGLLVHLSRGQFQVGDENNPQVKEPRKPWPGEAEWRKRALETRRKNEFYKGEVQWLETVKWFRKYHGVVGTQYTLKELQNMTLSYATIQRLVRNGYLKTVRRGLYEVM